MTPYHRIFALLLQGLLENTRYQVDPEFDVAVQQQRLDVLVVERTNSENTSMPELPNGFDLASYTLISFKSLRQQIDEDTLDELLHHYVSYRKYVSRNTTTLLAKDQFQLLLVTSREPREFFREFPPQEVSPGVYNLRWGSKIVRILVSNLLPAGARNAVVRLFGSTATVVLEARSSFPMDFRNLNTVVQELFRQYGAEEVPMGWEWKEAFLREIQEREEREEREFQQAVQEHVAKMPIKDRLEGVPTQEVLANIPLKERLEGVPAKEVLENIPIRERLEGVAAEDVVRLIPKEELLKSLTREEIEAFLQRNAPATDEKSPEPKTETE